MDIIFISIIVAIIVSWVVVIRVWKKKPSSAPRSLREVLTKRKPKSYAGGSYKPTPILSHNEIDFLSKLKLALPEANGYIFPQIAFSAFLRPIYPYQSPLFTPAFRAISQKRCDFLITDNEFQPLFVVECDDSSHKGKEKKDAERDRCVASAGIQTIRLYNGEALSSEKIRETLLSNVDVADKINRSFLQTSAES